MAHKDPEARKAYSKAYYAKNKDRVLEKNREWFKANADKQRKYVRNSTLKRLYGISQQDFDVMLSAQNFSCAICGAVDPEGIRKTFHVDHCHETGKVRGLLCNSCNLLLGLAKDNSSTLLSASNYLQAAK